MKFRSIKGTKDILPPESSAWQNVEATIRRVLSEFRYAEIRTPVFEQTSLFSRSIGELTDIVSKEMYTFQDRGGDSVTLRPEGTASVIRSYIQNNLGERSPVTKVYYIGPMFRQERPQAGRLRQFHQFGAEAIGSSSPFLDVEAMVIPARIYRACGITQFDLAVNSVGCENCRPAYRALLTAELRTMMSSLSEDSRSRLEKNPLRVLDSKDPRDQEATRNVPVITDHLCKECADHFSAVQSGLQDVGLSFAVNPRLVRGLDYYTKTAFEITSSALGSQDALAGGGRYDLLVSELGGKSTPGVGFAAGMERLLIALDAAGTVMQDEVAPLLYIVAADPAARPWAFRTSTSLRMEGLLTEIDYLDRSVKAQMREADRVRARYVTVIGGQELASGRCRLKRMENGEEQEIAFDAIGGAIAHD